jgi:hypothetical protein
MFRGVEARWIARMALGSLAIGAACQSQPGLDVDGTSAARLHDDASVAKDTGPESGGAACGNPYAMSNQPYAPCAVDSDCHDPFLACKPVSADACRDPDAGTDDAGCPPPPALDDLPICPTTAHVTLNACSVTYQQGCNVDSDCGPDGFTCRMNAVFPCPTDAPCGQCDEAAAAAVCTTAADCPAGWDCYTPCPCGAATPSKSCEPPFARFNCPACGPPLPP